MRVHFSAAEPCILRLGGAVAGYCGEAEKFADLPDGEKTVAEFFPLRGDLVPLAFVIDGGFFDAPPPECVVCRYDCGADVYAAQFEERGGTRIWGQARAGGVLATAFSAGGKTRLAVDTGGNTELYDLPPAREIDLGTEQIAGRTFARAFCRGGRGGTLLLYGQDGREALRAAADEWECGEKLTVRRRFADIAGHVGETVYACGENFVQESRTVRPRAGFDFAALDERLLPFAFFQEIAAGGDASPYLSPALLEKKHLLGEFLGDFVAAVLPKEIFYLTHGKQNAAALVYRRAENIYDIKFFMAEIQNGKISNIKPAE